MKKKTKTPKLNAEWHNQNHMPKNATMDERILWHIEHLKHCGCRRPSGKIKEEMNKRHIIV